MYVLRRQYAAELGDVFSKTEFVRLETEVYGHLLVTGRGTVDTYNIIHGILWQSLEVKKVPFLIKMKKNTIVNVGVCLSIYYVYIYMSIDTYVSHPKDQ